MSERVSPISEFKNLMKLYDVSKDTMSPPTVLTLPKDNAVPRRHWGYDTSGRVYVSIPITVEYGDSYQRRLHLEADLGERTVLTPISTVIIHQHHTKRDDVFSVISTVGLLTNRVVLGRNRASFGGMIDLLSRVPLFAYGVKYSDLGEPMEDPRFWVKIQLCT